MSPLLRFKDGTRPPEFQFHGYELRGGYPEFHYSLDGHPVSEWLRPLPDGRGFARHFRVDLPAGLKCRLMPDAQPGAIMTLGDGRPLGEGAGHFVSGGRLEFTVIVRSR